MNRRAGGLEGVVEGQTLSHYRLLTRIGAGGMGIVYKAEDTRLKRLVAIKVLPPHFTADPEARGRFEQEAQAACILDHPNICTIHEIDSTPDGQLFIVMAYCEGETLTNRIARGPLPVSEAVKITIQILRGLQKAHDAGIVHRDVKPANVIVESDGLVKLVDFGIAKLHDGAGNTRTGMVVGTVAYMAPEQLSGKLTDRRADLWSTGVVLHELLTGRTPFMGESESATVANILTGAAARLDTIRADVPRPVANAVLRALAKERNERYASATDFIADLRAWEQHAIAPSPEGATRRVTRAMVAVTLVAVAAIAGAIAWSVKRTADASAAERAFTEATTLARGDRYDAALAVAEHFEQLAPNDPRLPELMARVSVRSQINSQPTGADVFYKRFDDVAGPWKLAGRTPMTNHRFPVGTIRVKAQKAGYDTREFIANTAANMSIVLEAEGATPPAMLRVPASNLTLTLNGYDYAHGVPAAEYFIDRFEVTNEQFKAFVDAGGYHRREFWKQPFVEGGRTIRWDEALARFVDRTGRPGPSTWEVGSFPIGRERYPVNGVSWYEAAAYAEFTGKRLPTIYHWLRAAGVGAASFITPLSNFESGAPLPVGDRSGVTPIGAADMAGNVREWCENEMTAGTTRYILGGAWSDPRYTFYFADARSPFDRNELNGFRLVRYAEPPTGELVAAVPSPRRDLTSETPAADSVFAAYRAMYAYDPAPLDARVDATQDSEHWIRQKVSFSAAYGDQRMRAYVFLPKHGRPPYQVVVYGPGSSVVEVPTDELTQIANFDFLIRSGRAVLYPIVEGTFERRTDRRSVWPELTRAFRDWMIHVVNDVRRSVDYLEQRADIQKDAVAYNGFSWGAQFGTIAVGLEPRFRTAIMVSGGIASAKKLPEVDLFHFAPRVKVPVLMLNGDSDFVYSLEHGQKPLFKLLGSPPEHKRHVVYPGGHGLGHVRHQLIKETLDWLDKYVGPV